MGQTAGGGGGGTETGARTGRAPRKGRNSDWSGSHGETRAGTESSAAEDEERIRKHEPDKRRAGARPTRLTDKSRAEPPGQGRPSHPYSLSAERRIRAGAKNTFSDH